MANPEVNVVFTLDGCDVTIQCSEEEKMKDICQKYSTKVQKNMNSLIFLYGGNQLNLELSFKEQANSMDQNIKEMKVLVYKRENDEFLCPNCGEKIKLNMEKINELILSNSNLRSTLNGIKVQLDIIIKNTTIDFVNIQLKNIIILLNTLNDDINKNNQKLQNLISNNSDNNNSNIQDINNISNNNMINPSVLNNSLIDNGISNINSINNSINVDISNNSIYNNIANNLTDFTNKNMITGIIDIKSSEINNYILLFKSNINNGIDVYLNDTKINMKKVENQWKIDFNFEKTGKYKFIIIFNVLLDNIERLFEECTNIISLDFSNFDAPKVNNMYRLFYKCIKLKEIKGLDKLISNKIINICSMFQSCTSLVNLDLSNSDTSNVSNMQYLFKDCSKLKEIKGINLINTKKVVNIYGMFQSCSELQYLDLTNLDTSNVTNMEYIFDKCSKLKEIKGSNTFITSKVKTMEGMFRFCFELQYLDLSNFNTSNVTNMKDMFKECNKIKEIKGLINFNTKNVTNMSGMFKSCSKLENLDLSNFDTSNVNDMSDMFSQCIKLKEIKGINKLNSNQVRSMKEMFNKCIQLEYLDLSNFNTSNVNDMSFMFNECAELEEINLISKRNTGNTTNMFEILKSYDTTYFDTSNVEKMVFMFNGCCKLKKIKGINKFNTKNTTNMSGMFQFCSIFRFIKF